MSFSSKILRRAIIFPPNLMSPAPVSLMDKKAWPALKSCNQQKATWIASVSDLPDNDWLSQLPNDILMLIMSYFTMKEAARTSLLSHKWKQLWHCFPILTFEDSKAMERIKWMLAQRLYEAVCEERSIFVSRVNSVVEQHLGPYIDEFKVVFELDSSYQSHIDHWLIFAFAKQVKRLKLDCQGRFCRDPPYQFSLPFACDEPLKLHHSLDTIEPALTSLCLAYVNVTDQVVEGFLRFFPFLEELRIVKSNCLTSIRASDLSLSLIDLKVRGCGNLEIIDLSAPKLLSFGYRGQPIELHIRNASSLSKVSIGDWYQDTLLTYADDFLSKYSSQLEYLKLRINLFNEELQLNLGVYPSPAMMDLKHLQLCVSGSAAESLLEWTPLFEASPRLQKLKVQFEDCCYEIQRKIKKKHDKGSLKCLKTLEIVGYSGRAHELELVTYVLENANVLEEVTIDVQYRLLYGSVTIQEALETTKKLKEKLPQGVNFILKN